ncbi:MAG: hypothetical protein WCV92_04680 [Candidatus Buchananbacteria bacterium]
MEKTDIITKKPLYFFLHIPKTGGTTINQGLVSNHKDGEVIFLGKDLLGNKTSKNEIKKYLNSIPADKKKIIKVITGHAVYYGLHEIFPEREPRYIACFRHPVTLTISSYNYNLGLLKKSNFNFPDASTQELYDAKTLTFEEALFKYGNSLNSTFKFLVSRLFNDNYLNDEDCFFSNESENKILLKKIKERLSHFYFLGITEKSQDDFLFIADKLGITKYMPRENISTKFFSLTDNLLIKDNIQKFNLLDQNLYDYALSINNKYKQNNPDFNLSVKKMNKMFILNLVIDMFNIKHYPQNIYRFSNFLKQKSKKYALLVKLIKNLLPH